MKTYEQPKIVVETFLEQDVLTMSNGLATYDDIGTWGGWFGTNGGGFTE